MYPIPQTIWWSVSAFAIDFHARGICNSSYNLFDKHESFEITQSILVTLAQQKIESKHLLDIFRAVFSLNFMKIGFALLDIRQIFWDLLH